MKGGITEHGEESQGREEEGRQEAVTSPVRKRGGGRRPLFTFPTHLPLPSTHNRTTGHPRHPRMKNEPLSGWSSSDRPRCAPDESHPTAGSCRPRPCRR